MKTVTQRSKDCTACKLISGTGLIGMGFYVAYFSRKYRGFNRIGMLGVTAGFIFLGTSRLFDLPPFPLAK